MNFEVNIDNTGRRFIYFLIIALILLVSIMLGSVWILVDQVMLDRRLDFNTHINGFAPVVMRDKHPNIPNYISDIITGIRHGL